MRGAGGWLVLGLLVLGGALLAFVALRGGGGASDASKANTTAASATPPPRAPASPGHQGQRPVGTVQRRLAAALGATLRRAGPASGAEVYDLDAGQELFAMRGNNLRPPASLEKLYTSVTLLERMGAEARLDTMVLGAGHLGPGGVWHGDLYLRGGGDPTFGDGTFNQVWLAGSGPTSAQLAGQLHSAGIRALTGRLYGDESLLDTARGGPGSGMAADLSDYGGELSALSFDHGATQGALSPAAFAARQFARTLGAGGIRVQVAPAPRSAPTDARRLAVVSSPPMSRMLQLMNVPSDDLFAELLTEQLGLRFGDAATIASGAAVIRQSLSGHGIEAHVDDGSGLSRRDATTPHDLVKLLRSVWHTPTGEVLTASLPHVGVNGTVRRIAVESPARGRCVAKTGTLNRVTNLAGFCRTLAGRSLAFAFLLDGPDNERGIKLLGAMVTALVRYRS